MSSPPSLALGHPSYRCATGGDFTNAGGFCAERLGSVGIASRPIDRVPVPVPVPIPVPVPVPVLVLTNHARASLVMQGGTTFHFVTQGSDVALARAREAAKGRDVRVGGGVIVIRQYLRQRLIDEMHIAIAPVLLGAGERLFERIDLPALDYSCTEDVAWSRATHLVLSRV